ncbi:hypothetical protein [Acidithiobacillus sp.]|uniref:hypothetical protein n=1 Tax=Acidithiobacillus sp. TaxID=1872118 RepID=UPI0031FE60FE
MLILSRHEGESPTISLDSDIDPAMPVRELFVAGPLVITVQDIHRSVVQVGGPADPRLTVLRSELAARGTAET